MKPHIKSLKAINYYEKKLFLSICLALLAPAVRLMAQTAVTVQDCEPGTLWDRIETQGVNVETVTSLTVSGSLDDTDFRFIRRMLTSLEDIDLSGTDMTQVVGDAFNGCTHLKTCRLPLAVTDIGSNSFRDCSQLQSIAFGEATALSGTFLFHSNLSTICGDAFAGCQSVTCAGFSACTNINNIEGFNENCRKLTTVMLPQEGHYYIGGHAFCGTSIETLTLPTAVDHVDWHFIPSTMRTLVLKSKEPIGAADDAFDEVSHSNLRTMGDESITFEVLPDEGYYLEAIWLNGEELTVENGRFTIAADEANGMLTVAFTPYSMT